MKRTIEFYTLDSCLDGLSLDIMLSNIHHQLNNPQDIIADFLRMVGDTWSEIEEECEDETVISELKYKLIDFWGEVISLINSHFDLSMDYIADSMSAQDVAEELYEFFILDRIQNVETFFINYIRANKINIAQSLGINEKGKDVTSIACRRKDIDKTSIPIIANLTRVIDFICDTDLEVEELLNFSNADNAEAIEEMLLDYTINNNFTYTYINNIMSKYDGLVSSRIRNNIRTSLYR